jgi:hypothetical protein
MGKNAPSQLNMYDTKKSKHDYFYQYVKRYNITLFSYLFNLLKSHLKKKLITFCEALYKMYCL